MFVFYAFDIEKNCWINVQREEVELGATGSSLKSK